jgi:hypothetical protein
VVVLVVTTLQMPVLR